MKVDCLTVLYGEKYLELFYRTMLPTLAPNIAEMILDGCEVTHRIHCPTDEAACLGAYAQTAEWPVEIFTDGFNGDPGHDRHQALHPCYQAALQRGTFTVVAPGDHIFGNGLWPAIKGLEQGQYIVCGHPRIAWPEGVDRAAAFVTKAHSNENRELVRLCMDEIPHPLVSFGKLGGDTYWRTARKPDHYETFFVSPPPLAFRGTEDMLLAWSNRTLFGPLEVIDHDLVNHCHRYGKLKAITDSRQFFWAEWTDSRQYLHSQNSQPRTDLQLECMKFFNQTPMRWYL